MVAYETLHDALAEHLAAIAELNNGRQPNYSTRHERPKATECERRLDPTTSLRPVVPVAVAWMG